MSSFSDWEDVFVISSMFIVFKPGGLLRRSKLTVQCMVLMESSFVDTFSGITICDPFFHSITSTLGLLAGWLFKATGLLAAVGSRCFGFVGSRGHRIFNTSRRTNNGAALIQYHIFPLFQCTVCLS